MGRATRPSSASGYWATATPNTVSVPGDWFAITPPSSGKADVYATCLALNPNGLIGDANQNSYGGRTWITGYYTATRYNHLIPPNGISCTYNDNGATTIETATNQGATASTASSRHPGGVNVLFADGSIHFVKNSISNVVWWALGSKNGGEVDLFGFVLNPHGDALLPAARTEPWPGRADCSPPVSKQRQIHLAAGHSDGRLIGSGTRLRGPRFAPPPPRRLPPSLRMKSTAVVRMSYVELAVVSCHMKEPQIVSIPPNSPAADHRPLGLFREQSTGLTERSDGDWARSRRGGQLPRYR